MKKITLLSLIILFNGMLFGQTVLSEDFEAGNSIPASWNNNDIAGNGEVWTIESTGDAALVTDGNTNVYDAGGADGNYAAFDSDAYGNNNTAEEAALESPVFDASSLTEVLLTYNHYFAGDFGGTGFVEVSTDGTTWTTVTTYSGDGYQGGFISTDLTTELAGQATAQVRFRWTGNWSVAWYVDNITVFQCDISAPGSDTSATVPADGAVDVAYTIGNPNSLSFEWAAPTGDSVDSYNLSLGTTSSGDDIGTLEGFQSGGSVAFNFQPNTTYFWKVTAVNCAGETDSAVFSFTTEACSEANPPAAATSPTPADGATNVTIDANNNNGLTFNFTVDPTSVTSTLLFGTSSPPDNEINDFSDGGGLINLQPNTQYFWAIVSINCAGATDQSPIWTFTTGEALSIEENTIEAFSIYPNPVKDVLNIKTNSIVETVEVYNVSGQLVLNLNNDTIINNSVNLSGLNTGIFFVKVSSEKGSKTFKINKL